MLGLGITWIPKEDAFSFQVGEIPGEPSTKRAILSIIARLFDPLDWASPVVIQAKILMQDLWLAKIDWDDRVDTSELGKLLSRTTQTLQIENSAMDWPHAVPQRNRAAWLRGRFATSLLRGRLFTRFKIVDRRVGIVNHGKV